MNKWRPIKFAPLLPSEKPQVCDTMNGNIVLVPRKVAAELGNLSQEFSHIMGDTDYGLRARDKGFLIWIVPGYVGTCKRNPIPAWLDPATPLRTRLKVLHSPKGMPPREWTYFTRRHVGLCWPLYILSLYFRVLFPRLRKPSLKA